MACNGVVKKVVMQGSADRYIAGWNDYVAELHKDARKLYIS